MTLEASSRWTAVLARAKSQPLAVWAAWSLAAAPWFWIADFIIDLPATLAGLFYLVALLRGQAKLPGARVWAAGFLLVWALFLVGAVSGIKPSDALGLAGLWLRHPLLLAACLVWLAPQSLVAPARIWGPVAWSFLAATVFVALDGLLQLALGFDLFGYPLYAGFRLTGPLNEPIVGFFLTQLAPVLVALSLAGFGPWQALRAQPAWLRWGAGSAASLAIAAAVLVSGERLFAAWLVAGLAAILLLVALARPVSRSRTAQRRVDLALGAAGLALILGCVAALSLPSVRARLVDKSLSEVSAMLQVYAKGEISGEAIGAYANIHLRAAQAVANDPWTGHGMRGFRFYCPKVLKIENDNLKGCSTHPHQTWLNIAVAGGLPGLVVALVLAVAFLVQRALAMLRARHDPQRLVLAFLPLWAFAPIMVSPLSSEGVFVNFTENLLWVSLALTLAMEQSQRRTAV